LSPRSARCALLSGDRLAVPRLLEALGVRFVVVRRDIDLSYFDHSLPPRHVADPTTLEQALRDTPGATLRLSTGVADVFQVQADVATRVAQALGATLGSGAVIVFDDTADMKQMLLRIARFFRDESCGQCVPCRVGTKRQEEILERLLAAPHGDRRADVMLLTDIAQAMRDASICGLGQTAANAIGSGLTLLRVLNG